MKKSRKDHQFIKKPYYEGGISALKAFIKKHLTYPSDARKEKIEGTVFTRYSINHKGKVVDVKIISGIGYGCDEEAIRLLKLLQFNVPKNRKLKALFHRNLQIHFRLPKEKTLPKNPTPAPPIVQYSYISTSKSTKSPEKDKGESYDITIQF